MVLSGGGARGIAHVGALKGLQKMGITPSSISGTSAGAWCGAFYASGIFYDDVLKIIANTKIFRLQNLAFRKNGLMKKDFLIEVLRKNLPVHQFEKLTIPLFVCTTDFEKSCQLIFNSGDLIFPLAASASIPLLFQPVHFQGTHLVDGGLLNNLPVEPLQNHCDKIIAVNVNPISIQKETKSWKELIERSVQISVENTSEIRKPLCHLVLEPPELSQYGLLEFDKAEEIARIGFEFVMRSQKEIEQTINK